MKFCGNCKSPIIKGTKHLKMGGGWCEIIYQPKKIKAVVA